MEVKMQETADLAEGKADAISGGKPVYQRVGRHDAVYDDGIIKLKLTVEDFKAKDGKWGEAVYLSEVKPPLAPEDKERVANNIRNALIAEGQHYSIE
jgi:hypothetical protein